MCCVKPLDQHLPDAPAGGQLRAHRNRSSAPQPPHDRRKTCNSWKIGAGGNAIPRYDRGPPALTSLLVSLEPIWLDDGEKREYHEKMKSLCAHSLWRSLLAAVLVAMLALLPTHQGHASAAHSDHFAVQSSQNPSDAQRADCCIDAEGADHALKAACASCVLPCMSALHALIPSPLVTSFSGDLSYLLPDGQVVGGLAAAPDPRPPKTHS